MMASNTNIEAKQLINLNVGGKKFTTTMKTVLKCQKLADMVEKADSSECFVTEQDEVFIDRDGDAFGYILQYLREDNIESCSDETLKKIRNEAKFYQLDDLEKKTGELLKEKMPAEKVYRLLERYELNQLSSLNPESTTTTTSLSSSKSNYQFITTVRYVHHVYKCPRGIIVHDLPYKCGYKCKKVPLCDHTGWVYESAEKYLVAYEITD